MVLKIGRDGIYVDSVNYGKNYGVEVSAVVSIYLLVEAMKLVKNNIYDNKEHKEMLPGPE